MQVATGQTAASAPAQAVQPATKTMGVTDTGAMDVDRDATAQEAVGEGQSGVKRKAGEDTELASKKPKMGMFVSSLHPLMADPTITRRTCRCSFEEVRPTGTPLILQLLMGDCRDRENCTVFVSDLPESATEDDLKALFKDVSLPPPLVWKSVCSRICSPPSVATSERLR